jgi:DNA-binding MarR family transcriptional regulator
MDDHDVVLINDLLGSSHVFSLAVARVEENLWRHAAENELTVTQMRLLMLVNHPGSSHTIGDVAAFLGISNAAASKAVDKLVRSMLVKRREGDTDRRAIHLSLTGAGRRILESYDAAAKKKLAEAFGQVCADEIRPVVQLLDRLSFSMMADQQLQGVCVQCGIYFRDQCVLRQRYGRTCLYLRGKERAVSRAQQPESLPNGDSPD